MFSNTRFISSAICFVCCRCCCYIGQFDWVRSSIRALIYVRCQAPHVQVSCKYKQQFIDPEMHTHTNICVYVCTLQRDIKKLQFLQQNRDIQISGRIITLYICSKIISTFADQECILINLNKKSYIDFRLEKYFDNFRLKI